MVVLTPVTAEPHACSWSTHLHVAASSCTRAAAAAAHAPGFKGIGGEKLNTALTTQLYPVATLSFQAFPVVYSYHR